MCIHVLQMRTPPILPCLQRMTPHTYDITIDGKECAYYDRMDKLTLETGFDSSMNKESIAQLVYAFFDYWAWRHNYSNDVVSIRLGGLTSKQQKKWTRRVGNDRHLICIEDPFEVSHDLGRVVDHRSIGVLRNEFIRASKVLREHQDSFDILFAKYEGRQ
mmetsp:Transcript_6021/g.11513  ORF Transcript_6021/g.11513 Transcript_6021/m.11513 type:complete len:160 (-) Transcript_6021:728-1207(-)